MPEHAVSREVAGSPRMRCRGVAAGLRGLIFSWSSSTDRCRQRRADEIRHRAFSGSPIRALRSRLHRIIWRALVMALRLRPACRRFRVAYEAAGSMLRPSGSISRRSRCLCCGRRSSRADLRHYCHPYVRPPFAMTGGGRVTRRSARDVHPQDDARLLYFGYAARWPRDVRASMCDVRVSGYTRRSKKADRGKMERPKRSPFAAPRGGHSPFGRPGGLTCVLFETPAVLDRGRS